MSDIKQYEPLWGSWYVDSLLGEGSYGKVYKVRREEFGRTYEAAVKIISIPQNDAELRSAQNEGLDAASARSYFHAFVTDIVQEIALMSEFRGNSNIVSLEDHKVIEREGEIGWDILIRMELLTTLSDYVTERPLSREDVMRLGVHICRALELCARRNTIHRDIKPDNIFVSQYGDYKLGDFGIARQIERTMSGLSKKGTYTYMAPEVFREDEYGASVDLYSLGIVMYRFLNQNRTPFLPPFPNPITPRDRDEALQRRMRGEPLPPIPNLDPALSAVVLKACAYDRAERFKDAAEMKTALLALLGEEPEPAVPLPVLPPLPTRAPVEAPEERDDQEPTEGGMADDLEEQEGTLGLFSPRDLPPVQEPEPDASPAQPKPKLAIVGGILFGLLGMLTFLSGDRGDITLFLPMYALCAAQCVLRFENKPLNVLLPAAVACYLLFCVFQDFRPLDYSFVILEAALLSLGAVRVGKRIPAASCALLAILAVSSAGFVAHLGLNISYAYAAKAAALPLLLLLACPAAPLLERRPSWGWGLLLALHGFLLAAFAAYAWNRASVYFYIADASFVGFSPERFPWWRGGRFGGLLFQVLAFGALFLIAAEKVTPERYQEMLEKGNGRKILLAFAASFVVMVVGLGVIGWLPMIGA